MHLHILKELGLLLLYNNTPNCLDVDQILLDIVRENIKDQDGDCPEHSQLLKLWTFLLFSFNLDELFTFAEGVYLKGYCN